MNKCASPSMHYNRFQCIKIFRSDVGFEPTQTPPNLKRTVVQVARLSGWAEIQCNIYFFYSRKLANQCFREDSVSRRKLQKIKFCRDRIIHKKLGNNSYQYGVIVKKPTNVFQKIFLSCSQVFFSSVMDHNKNKKIDCQIKILLLQAQSIAQNQIPDLLEFCTKFKCKSLRAL